MNKLLLIKNLCEELNRRFPPATVDTRLYKNRELKEVKIKQSDNFIITVDKKFTSIEIHCFRYHLQENKFMIFKSKSLCIMLDIKNLNFKFNHIVSQRRIKIESIMADKIVFGKTW